ncbi:MAG TPA: hypothetical protein VJ888_00255, partial [Mobilitalea sp.]|nr:hypothetical protein [Mobilitalea sp.]
IPAIYACSSGLVVDFCVQVKPDRIKEFINKCDLSHEDDSSFTDEEREEIKVDNPLNIDFRSQIVLNGKTLHQKHSCSMNWIPDYCLPKGTESDLESKWVLEHYGLDPTMGWVNIRTAFPWATKTKPTIKLLRLKLEQEPVSISRIYFNTLDFSKSFPFTHPITGAGHTLTVLDYEKQEIEQQHFHNENQEFPTHYTMMTYVLSPELPDRAFLISDCEKGDRPRQKVNNTLRSRTSGAVAIGIIGGTDGPTAIFLSKSSTVKPHIACSALRYEPVNEVKWRLEFREKMRDDIEVELIKNEKALR